MGDNNHALAAPDDLSSFGNGLNVAVVGAAGGIGRGFANGLAGLPRVARAILFARTPPAAAPDESVLLPMDIEDESSVSAAAEAARASVGELHLVVVASGVLHDGAALQPEKSWRSLNPDAIAQAFRVNATGPALVAKHFLPLLARGRKAAFAALSARVGSISDNRLGGWYAYRASKAALNMLVRTFAIELARVNPTALCVALHPGTVDTHLSEPFQANVPSGRLFAPDFAAQRLLAVLDRLTPAHSGRLFAWDGKEIPF